MKAQGARGVSQKDIAAHLGVHPKTVSRAIKRAVTPAPRASRGSDLDPFKPTSDRLLSEGVWNSVVIVREIQARGYDGTSSLLRASITPKRAQRPCRATVRFKTEPGQHLQRDWGEIRTVIGGEATTVHFIVHLLGYSRRFHAWCSRSADAEHTYEGSIRSLEYFGGVPQEVLACAVT